MLYYVIGCSKWKSRLKDVDDVKSIIRELRLDEKTTEELKDDKAELQKWRSNMLKHRSELSNFIIFQ